MARICRIPAADSGQMSLFGDINSLMTTPGTIIHHADQAAEAEAAGDTGHAGGTPSLAPTAPENTHAVPAKAAAEVPTCVMDPSVETTPVAPAGTIPAGRQPAGMTHDGHDRTAAASPFPAGGFQPVTTLLPAAWRLVVNDVKPEYLDFRTGQTRTLARSKEAVVNDCKVEFEETTDVNFLGEAEQISLLPQGEERMSSIEKLERHIRHMRRTGDQQPMRNAVKVMIHTAGMTVDGFANLDVPSMASQIEAYASGMNRRPRGDAGKAPLITADMHEPVKLARKIKMAFRQLSQQFPDEHFPEIPEAVDGWVHPYMFGSSGPQSKLRQELASWMPQLRGEAAGTGKGKPLLPETVEEYKKKLLQIVTFCKMAKITIGLSFGIEFMTDPDSVALWLPLLQSHYSGKAHAPLIAAVKRIAADVLTDKHPNVTALAVAQRAASRKHQNKSLSADDVENLRDLTRPEEAVGRCQIWDLPEAVHASGDGSRLRPADRDSRKSCAVAVEIMLCAPALAPQHLARINLESDVRPEGGGRQIRCTDHDGAEEWVGLSDAAIDRIDRLEVYRAAVGRQSPWLFRNRTGRGPQTRQIAMTALAKRLNAALGRHVDMVELRDASMVNLVDNGTNDPKTLGDTFGLDPRTIERRLAIVLEVPLPPAAEAA